MYVCGRTIALYIHGTYMVQTCLCTFMLGGQDSRWKIPFIILKKLILEGTSQKLLLSCFTILYKIKLRLGLSNGGVGPRSARL